MPTLFRFVVTLAVLAGIAYGAMFALVMFVQPKQAALDATGLFMSIRGR